MKFIICSLEEKQKFLVNALRPLLADSSFNKAHGLNISNCLNINYHHVLHGACCMLSLVLAGRQQTDKREGRRKDTQPCWLSGWQLGHVTLTIRTVCTAHNYRRLAACRPH